jgi:hypothetical protein
MPVHASDVARRSSQQDLPESTAREQMELIERLASEEINSGDSFLGKTRFAVRAEDHAVYYDLGRVSPKAVLSGTDPLAIPLEATIRMEALRRDFRTSAPSDKFWAEPLDSVRRAVSDCVGRITAEKAGAGVVASGEQCSNELERRFDALRRAIELFAVAHDLTTSPNSQSRDPAAGYRVQVRIEPPRARIRVMTALEYRKCNYFKIPLEDQWIDLVAQEQDMIGRYRYLAEWPVELGGPEEGEFEVKKAGSMVFHPKQH